jgi:hypothetical protein
LSCQVWKCIETAFISKHELSANAIRQIVDTQVERDALQPRMAALAEARTGGLTELNLPYSIAGLPAAPDV